MIQCGTFNRRITIEQLAGTLDGNGQEVQTWTTFASRWASMLPLSAREMFAQQQFQGRAYCKFRMWYTAGVTPKMRVKLDTRVFDIQSAVDPDNNLAVLEIVALERV